MTKANVQADVKPTPPTRRVPVTRIRPGQRGRIVEITGGCGLASKLEAIGIRQGKEVTKISGQLMRGPVVLQHGNIRLALGFGMASRILVEVTEKDRP